MAQRISPTDQRLTWAGTVSLQVTPEWTAPTRIPFGERALFAPSLVEKAGWAAGARLSFWSDTDEVGGEIEPVEGLKPVDMCIDGELARTAPLDGKMCFAFEGLGRRRKLVDLWVPHVMPFHLKSLRLTDGATVEPFVDERPKWITYGSSITHCAEALSPTGTWPAVVARHCGYNLLSLGYGAECHQDVMVARMIRDLSADFISLKLGINDQILLTHNERTFPSSIIDFVRIIRETHTDIPIVLISAIISPPREETPNAVGMTIGDYRRGVEAAALALRDAGDEHLFFVDGLEIFGEAEATPELLPDNLHPGSEGYRLMAGKFIEHVANPFFGYNG